MLSALLLYMLHQLSSTAECRFEIILCLCRKYILAVIRETNKKMSSQNKQKKEHKQVIKNIRNVTRHRNGQSVKSRQTR